MPEYYSRTPAIHSSCDERVVAVAAAGYECLASSTTYIGAVYMSLVNRASSGHEILFSVTKGDLNYR